MEKAEIAAIEAMTPNALLLIIEEKQKEKQRINKKYNADIKEIRKIMLRKANEAAGLGD